jgi:hypothetical protein
MGLAVGAVELGKGAKVCGSGLGLKRGVLEGVKVGKGVWLGTGLGVKVTLGKAIKVWAGLGVKLGKGLA